MCAMAIESNPVPTKTNPLGAKGAGEAGTVGALPAVMLAILNALAPLGVTELDMPATRMEGDPRRPTRRVTKCIWYEASR